MGKKKHEHHGGAWKVAYADFVTAMMALFMVLWISAQDQEILIATSRYFQNPFSTPMDRTYGVMAGDKDGGGGVKQGDSPESTVVDMAFLHQLANDLYRLLDVQKVAEDEKPIDISVINEGLRITVFNRREQPFFLKDSAVFTRWGELVVQNLAWLMDRYNMAVVIESYTADSFRSGSANYGPWELSGDRANAMRRGLVHYALDPEKIDRVTAYVSPAPKDVPPDEADLNQRVEISLIMKRSKN
ncbi:MAG: flagellar motor protein MotB [Opitutales bacterium]|nr:flagellar motor protein MotB [Opitutales bacterium]